MWRTVAARMCKAWTRLLVLLLCAGGVKAWFWNSVPKNTTTTKAPNATTTAGPTGATPAANGTEKKEVVEDDNLSGVGEEIINVATGIRKFVQAWDTTPTPTLPARTTTKGGLTEKVEGANPNTTGNGDRLKRGRVEEGARGAGVVGSDMVLWGDRVLFSHFTENFTGSDGSSDPVCAPLPSDWPICSRKNPRLFSLPNFLNHTSVAEVGAVLREWAWLPKERCHPGAEWFLCLLLAPRCPSPSVPRHLPCRRFCQVLQDSCWASLENGRLPVECHDLPERPQERGRPACVSVSNWKGNPGGLECILLVDTF